MFINRILSELFVKYEINELEKINDFSKKTFSDDEVSFFFVGCLLIMFSLVENSMEPVYLVNRELLLDIVSLGSKAIDGENLLLYYVNKVNTKKGIIKYFNKISSDRVVEYSIVVSNYLEQFKPSFSKNIESKFLKNVD